MKNRKENKKGKEPTYLGRLTPHCPLATTPNRPHSRTKSHATHILAPTCGTGQLSSHITPTRSYRSPTDGARAPAISSAHDHSLRSLASGSSLAELSSPRPSRNRACEHRHRLSQVDSDPFTKHELRPWLYIEALP